jgi:hypothetical protein
MPSILIFMGGVLVGMTLITAVTDLGAAAMIAAAAVPVTFAGIMARRRAPNP